MQGKTGKERERERDIHRETNINRDTRQKNDMTWNEGDRTYKQERERQTKRH